MRFLKILLIIIVVLLIQTMVLSRNPWLRMIDLFLLFNIYYALNYDQFSSQLTALGSGLIQDSFSQGIIGMNAFSKIVVAFFISSLSSRLMIKHPLIVMLLIVLGTCIDFLLLYGLHRMFRLPAFAMTPNVMIIAALLNSVPGLLGFQIMDRMRMKKEYV